MSFVEANSLSSITTLASNPPKYPRNPTEQKQPSLILYIQRVPGSRDVILTPMKPSRKNVTYEDVASSLYFLHYRTPEDEAALAASQTEYEARKSSDTVRTLPRKPVATNVVETASAVPRRSSPTALGGAGRKPLPPPHDNLSDLPSQARDKSPRPLSLQPQGPLQRPALGRSASTASTISRKAVPNRMSYMSGDAPTYFTAHSDRTRNPDPTSPTESLSAPSSQHRSGPSFQDFIPPDQTGFTVTMIRRDPTSGAQWNVGEISSIASETTDTNHAVTVKLSTPGYGRFKSPQTWQATDDTSSTNHDKTAQQQQQQQQSTTFDREIRMDTEWTSLIERAKSIKLTRPTTLTRIPTSIYPDLSDRRPSTDSNNTPRPTFTRTSTAEQLGLGPKRPRAKGYVFLSPWNGRCEFLTGTSGRSLKCKHTLQNYTSDTATPSHPVSVSELRFNLPTGDIFGATPRTFGLDTKRARLKLAGLKSKLSSAGAGAGAGAGGGTAERNWSEESEDEDEERDRYGGREEKRGPRGADADADGEEDRLDLSLGQEKAGGGNRGKRAKLGKLIVHHEGLKMLDLIVAANMGIWWETWER